VRLDELTVPAQLNDQNLCYLCVFVIDMQQMPSPFNHKAIIVPLLSAAGHKADFMFSAFADVEMLKLLTGNKHYQNDPIRYLPESQDNCNWWYVFHGDWSSDGTPARI
jgi:hypothetical protein